MKFCLILIHTHTHILSPGNAAAVLFWETGERVKFLLNTKKLEER